MYFKGLKRLITVKKSVNLKVFNNFSNSHKGKIRKMKDLNK